MGKTAFALAHALNANGSGRLHTVGPFDANRFLPRYYRWPKALRDRTTFYPMNSADFFAGGRLAPRAFDLVLVDGNHDYEYALFDIAEIWVTAKSGTVSLRGHPVPF